MPRRTKLFLLISMLYLLYLIVAQAVSAFNYEWGVAMGTQEPANTISEVGTAFFYGFAWADAVFYIPLLGISLVLLIRKHALSPLLLAASMGITVYWPLVCLSTLVAANKSVDWDLESETGFWVVLPLIVIYGMWGLQEAVRFLHHPDLRTGKTLQ